MMRDPAKMSTVAIMANNSMAVTALPSQYDGMSVVHP